MILSIHNLSEKYGVLPSHTMANADTFDFYVLDVATRWEQYMHEQQKAGKPIDTSPKNSGYSEKQLLAILQAHKNKIGKNNNA